MVLLHRLADSATVVTSAVVGLVADAALPVPFDLDSGDASNIRHGMQRLALQAQQALKRDPQAVIPIEPHLLAAICGCMRSSTTAFA
jgi:hypothetical protein